MNDENRIFEVDLIVRAAGQKDARVSREYVSANKASTDGAAGEIFGAIDEAVQKRMRPVADQD
jgi:hypothetical protein